MSIKDLWLKLLIGKSAYQLRNENTVLKAKLAAALSANDQLRILTVRYKKAYKELQEMYDRRKRNED